MVQSLQQPASVNAQVLYGKRPANGERIFNYMNELPKGQLERSNFEIDFQTVQITDLREVAPLTLLRNGIQLERLSDEQEINWDDEQQVIYERLSDKQQAVGEARLAPTEKLSLWLELLYC